MDRLSKIVKDEQVLSHDYVTKFWNFLNDLSEKDPKQYEDFIKKQAESFAIYQDQLKSFEKQYHPESANKDEASSNESENNISRCANQKIKESMMNKLSNITTTPSIWPKSKKTRQSLIQELD